MQCSAVQCKGMEGGEILSELSFIYLADLNGTSFSSMCSMDWRLKRRQIIIIRGQTVIVARLYRSRERARVNHAKKQ